MKRVAFIADDFGVSDTVNRAILRGHREGALNGASLMTGQPGTAHAAALARDNPTLQIGWHLHLCDSRPVTRPSWPWGCSPLRAGLALATAANRRFVADELAAQWELFRNTGLSCEFVNAHHHLHVHRVVLRELRRILPPDFAGWIRGFGVRRFGGAMSWGTRLTRLAAPWIHGKVARSGFRHSETLWGLDRLFSMQAGEVRAALEGLPEGLHEFIFHPRACEGDADIEALIQLRSMLPTTLPSPRSPA